MAEALGCIMESIGAPSQSFLGSGAQSLIYVEVIPLRVPERDTADICLSAPRAKLILQRLVCPTILKKGASVKIIWQDMDSQDVPRIISGSLQHNTKPQWSRLYKSGRTVPILYLPSDHPRSIDPCPCWVLGYGLRNHVSARGAERLSETVVSKATLVRILPVEVASFEPQGLPLTMAPTIDWKDVLTRELRCRQLSPEMVEEVLNNHDEGTIRALTLRLSLLLQKSVSIGTTGDALVLQQKRQNRGRTMCDALALYRHRKQLDADDRLVHSSATYLKVTKDSNLTEKFPLLLREGALLVHSPDHGAGKTLLVQAIAQKHSNCDLVHVIQPGALIAKYGTYSDAALDCILHMIVSGAACRRESLCIILDNIDVMLPPKLSGRRSNGDAAIPVLNTIESYLKNLFQSLKRYSNFLFPNKNPLYSISGKNGHVLTTNVCLVGITTCPDDGGRPIDADRADFSTILNALSVDRYRLPSLSAKARLLAFQYAFRHIGVHLSLEAAGRLPLLAASAVVARGSAFSSVARRLSQLVEGKQEASVQDLELALLMQDGNASSSRVEFSGGETGSGSENEVFASVGGNTEAKQAIEEALALDSQIRQIFEKFALFPPSGVLLFGPPGTGKTLLAKAVSRCLKSQGANLGGAFISLQASDIARGEVGNSEKMLVAAFETARTNAPSVVFIDEFQALFTERSGSGSGKLASTLLQCMDDVCRWRKADNAIADAAESSRVVVMGATNTPWMVDKAFLRPGRFDRVVHVGLPNTEERVSILHVHVSRMRLESTHHNFVDEICRSLADSCDGFSGADLAALCRAAAVHCLAESGDKGKVTARHFHEARQNFVISCSTELVQRLADWRP